MIVRIGMDDVAEDDVADVGRLDAGPADGLAHAQRRQLTGREILQATAVAADRRPRAAQDDDLSRVTHRKPSR